MLLQFHIRFRRHIIKHNNLDDKCTVSAVPRSVMEEGLGHPVAKKTKEESGSVLLTYFQGDINSMVDEHFSRALSQANKPKEERYKIKRNHKVAQTSNCSS